MELARSAP